MAIVCSDEDNESWWRQRIMAHIRNTGPYYYIALSLGEMAPFNILRPRQNGLHFPDDIFKWIFVNENMFISIKISLKVVPRGLINKIPAFMRHSDSMSLIGKSKDYVYGIWVYKVLDIWKGYYRVKKITSFMHSFMIYLKKNVFHFDLMFIGIYS